MCVMNLQKNSLLCLTQKTLTVFFLSVSEAYLKKGCSWQVQGETERYRSKCICTNTSNTVPDAIKYFFVIIQPSFYLLITASNTFISVQVTAFPYSVQEINLLAVVLTFCLYVYKPKTEWMQNQRWIIKSDIWLLNVLSVAFQNF